jgi:hypothetical protein
MITCTQCQAAFPHKKFWTAWNPLRLQCPACQTELHAGPSSRRVIFLAMAAMMSWMFISIVLGELLNWSEVLDWSVFGVGMLVIVIFWPLQVWRRGDYSHEFPPFQFKAWHFIVTGLGACVAFIACVMLIMPEPSSRLEELEGLLPPGAVILPEALDVKTKEVFPEELECWSQIFQDARFTRVRVKVTLAEYNHIVDTMGMRGYPLDENHFCHTGEHWLLRLAYRDGYLIFDELVK